MFFGLVAEDRLKGKSLTNLLKGNTRFKGKSQVCDEPIRIIGLPQTFEYAVITKGKEVTAYV